MIRQALHIFKKDLRQLWIPAVAVLALTIWFSYNAVEPWSKAMRPQEVASTIQMNHARQVAADQGAVTFDVSSTVSGGAGDVVVPMLLLAWFFLVARLIHADAIPGDRQFWLTRPYNRKSLLAAKALFVLTFINLPMLTAQAAILAADGLPVVSNLSGLLWEQVILTIVIVMPALALAAMTSTMAQFIGWGLVICVALVMTQLPFGSGDAMEWMRTSLGVALICFIAASVLLLQFLRRRTRLSRIVAVGGMLVTWAAASGDVSLGVLPMFLNGGFGYSDGYYGTFRWKAIHSIEARLFKPASLPRLEIDRSAPSIPPATGWIDLRLRTTGLPEGTLLVCHSADVTVDNGSIQRSGEVMVTSTLQRAPEPCRAILYLPPDSARKFGSQPVRIHVNLYMTIFGGEHSTPIALDKKPVSVPGVGPCAAAEIPDAPAAVWCRVAFRWPSRVVTVGGSLNPLERFTQFLSYAPFPADLSFNPVETHLALAKPDANGLVTVAATETMSFARAELDINDVRLTDF